MRNQNRIVVMVAGKSAGLMGGLALSLLVGCAGTQKKDTDNAGSGLGPNVSSDPLGVLDDDKSPKRKVSAEEREDFDKAMATWVELRAKSGGRLSGSDCDRAANAFEKAADDNPNLQEARYNQGAVLLECGRRNEAMAIFEKLAKGPTPYARAVTNMGLAAWDKGDKAEAERLFTRAIEIDPNIDSAAARNNLAQILRDRMIAASGDQRKQYAQQAIRHLRTVLAVDGNNLQAYATLCHVYFELGLDDMAKLVGNQAVARAEEIATGNFSDQGEDVGEEAGGDSKGDSKKGKKGGAKAGGSKSLRSEKGTGYTVGMNQQLALTFNTLGLVELKKKNVTGALANFSRAIERDPSLYEARMNRAAISLNFRNYTTAEEDFRVVLKAQPQNYEAAIGLGVALRGGKKVEEAEQQYLAAMKLDPANPKAYYNLGLLYQDYKGGQKPELQKAQQYYRDYLTKAGSAERDLRRSTEKRIKDIDEMFVALEEAEKMQREYEEMLRQAEEQQKKMEEEMKRQEQQDAATQPAPAGATAPGGPQSATEPGAGAAATAAR